MKIILKVYYCIIFILSLLFELVTSAVERINWNIKKPDDYLLNYLINVGYKIDGK